MIAPGLNAVSETCLPATGYSLTATGSRVDLKGYTGEVAFHLVSQGATGTDGKEALAFAIQDSAAGTTFADVTGGGFTSVGNAAADELIRLDTRKMNRYVTATLTITATTIFTADGGISSSVSMIGVKQY